MDLGGCALDNPMDLIPNEITEMPAIDIDEDSLVLSTHPDLEVSHAGFISELKESGKDRPSLLPLAATGPPRKYGKGLLL